MKKFTIIFAAAILMMTFVGCDDPMDEIAPVKETPAVKTDGTGDGGGPIRPCPTCA